MLGKFKINLSAVIRPDNFFSTMLINFNVAIFFPSPIYKEAN